MLLALLVACASGPDADSATSGETTAPDADGDGTPDVDDCGATDPAVSPRATEVPYDGLDNDCDPATPDDDLDGDGVANAVDCDDADAGVSPSVPEAPYDNVDNDCDPTTADDDLDGDGFGLAVDCDDALAGVSPAQRETTYDGLDNDCDPATPDDDLDGDGHGLADDCDDGDATSTLPADDADCDGAPTAADCDDTDATLGGLGSLLAAEADLALVCAGTYTIGCTPGQDWCESNADSTVEVTLTHAFWIATTEVTQAEYSTWVGTNPSGFADCGADCPVETVSWHQAAAYTNLLSAAAGLERCYDCAGSGTATRCTLHESPYTCDGYRLPTEAEWEIAARCGEDLAYAGSAYPGAVGWYATNSGDTTHPVGSLDANACGTTDMSGNVWEWTNDWYDADQYTTWPVVTDPLGPSSATYTVFRGGNWSLPVADIQVSHRGAFSNTHTSDTLGFRVARGCADGC